MNAILYADRTGCAWRYLPKNFPPWRTVYGYFAAWRDDGTLQRIHYQLREAARSAAGRAPGWRGRGMPPYSRAEDNVRRLCRRRVNTDPGAAPEF